ncbi:hypothetical protein [Lysinibacillus agricola]|uniref:hypothetical protein n=1 Tax=Lysinibacillus agricola TaxID=2590012 RepID=UPI003C1465B6
MKQQKLLQAHDKMAENNFEAQMLVQAFSKASPGEKAQQQLVENHDNVHGMSSTDLLEAAALAEILKNGVE